MEMDKDTVISYFSLDDAIVKDAYGMGPMMSAHIDMIVAIETAKQIKTTAQEKEYHGFMD